MRVSVLVDNTGAEGLQGEWGLSMVIEYGQKKVMLDAGASPLFAENAEKMGISLAEIDCAVLSHAHYDHANGMEPFFAQNSRAKFYLREGCRENCYARKKLFTREYIGMPRGVLEKYSDRIVTVSGIYAIADDIWLLPHSAPVPPAVGRRDKLYVLEGRRLRPDDFCHEQSLVFDTPRGLVVFNSCSHSGADRILDEVAAAFPDRKLLALIGGFHMFRMRDEEVRAMAVRLRQIGVERICTGHCTGERALGILREELGEKVQALRVGLVMDF